ncbi:hypothetical protein LTR62_004753 [Meristemomyces frigidus]|uniref:N-acetyltransferase domain-containing protein n=1 Tax=Meristemomyces frigidus TaxID=1508187 RepID=A0AAN7TE19_9PEZI|nr:hypothetical protein LTR62_004753 [Meristemomyces frigidus]
MLSFLPAQVLSDPDEFTLRPLTSKDIPGFVEVYLAAFSPGPIWKYTHFDSSSLRNYTRDCVRKVVEQEWHHHPDSVFANAITVPDHDEGAADGVERLVSFAVWHWLYPDQDQTILSTLQLPTILSGPCSDRLDTNLTRAAQVQAETKRVEDIYFRNLTSPQLYLNLLATHPDWDGHGFGAAQVEFGMEVAKARDAPVTLIATPAGYPLYDSLGFSSGANLTLEMYDGLGTLWFEYMRWNGTS